jgi:anthranilate synthase component 2
VHYLEDLNCEVTVYRNDEFELDEINHFDKILLSPGPGILMKQVVESGYSKIYPTKSIFGVCLGQQAIGEVYGGTLSNLEKCVSWYCYKSNHSSD